MGKNNAKKEIKEKQNNFPGGGLSDTKILKLYETEDGRELMTGAINKYHKNNKKIVSLSENLLDLIMRRGYVSGFRVAETLIFEQDDENAGFATLRRALYEFIVNDSVCMIDREKFEPENEALSSANIEKLENMMSNNSTFEEEEELDRQGIAPESEFINTIAETNFFRGFFRAFRLFL